MMGDQPNKRETTASPPTQHPESSLLLPQLPFDLQMHAVVESYLELEDLRNLSQVSCDGNATVAAVLRKQLDRACKNNNNTDKDYRFLPGTEFLHRLAQLDADTASRLRLLSSSSSQQPQEQPSKQDAPCHTNSTNNTNTRTRRLRQSLSDGWAAVHEQRRQAAERLWSHCGAGAVLVVVMAGRLFFQSVRERWWNAVAAAEDVTVLLLMEQEALATAATSSSCVQEEAEYGGDWKHDISRLVVGTVFAVTVAVGVSKQQERRKRRRRVKAFQQEGANKKNKTLKRSQSVASDLAAGARSSSSLDVPSPRRSFRATTGPKSIPLSVSTPNLHRLLLGLDHDDDDETTMMEHRVRSPSDMDDKHHNCEESLWHVSDDDEAAGRTRRMDPLVRPQREPEYPTTKTVARSGSSATKKQAANTTMKPTAASTTTASVIVRTPPTGCVGAYERAVSQAKAQVGSILKDQRQRAFAALPTDAERTALSTAFIDACTDDASLDVARRMAQRLPLDDFYVGSDGTECCALHTAAFHGANQILDFLCRGVDCSWKKDNSDDYADGGMCNVNVRDANGWTALHFAAGANCVDAVRVLVAHGATLDVEAVNGYTPLQWALRLQNRAVADELRRWLEQQQRNSSSARRRGVWRRRLLVVLPAMLLAVARRYVSAVVQSDPNAVA